MVDRPSKRIANILSNYFPQNKDFEKSIFPINIDYSVPFAEISKRRIIIYQTNGNDTLTFLGDKEDIRNFTFDVIVASDSADESFCVSNLIRNVLKKYKDAEYVRIKPINDISPMGKNAKKLWLYTCSYNIELSK